jgi:hypothetical protein
MPGSKPSVTHVDGSSLDRYATDFVPAIGSSTDRGVGLKMRNSEGSTSWSRFLRRSI